MVAAGDLIVTRPQPRASIRASMPSSRFYETLTSPLAISSAPKRSIALRGDIGALTIQEGREDLSCRSQINGVVHACGHDMHSSIALGAALPLERLRHNFVGKVRIFFQWGDEAELVGGRTLHGEHLLDGFDRAVGFHISLEVPSGILGAQEGAVTKSADQFKLTITGKMAHGPSPHSGTDAIAVAAAFVNEVQKLVSREMPADDGAIVSIGTIHGGKATNIICPSVVMEGTIRTSSSERRALLSQRVREAAEGGAVTHRGAPVSIISHGAPRWSTTLKWSVAFGNSYTRRLAAMLSSLKGDSRPAAMTSASIPRACPPSISGSAVARPATHRMCTRQHLEPPMTSLFLRPGSPSDTSSIC